MLLGGLVALIGVFADVKQFAFSWLTAFMFYTSLVVGSLFMVIAHHLFDAAWSVPIRRICEQMAVQSKWIAAFWVVILIFSKQIYPWMGIDPETDALLEVKAWLFNPVIWTLASVLCLGLWVYFSHKLRAHSLRQDETGAAECTGRMRVLSYLGVVFAIAIGITFGSILWMKGLMHQWFSTMYGVTYFAGSVWTTLFTVYVIAAALKRTGPLREVATDKTFYFLGTLMFAFTVFYAYVTFSQYFIIWNANIPEETFWYQLREVGTWKQVAFLMIFGHFFLPFLLFLRIDFKLKFGLVVPMAGWAWLMHYMDMQYNIMPVLHQTGFHLSWIDIGCFLFMGGFLTNQFLKSLAGAPVYPQRDPRMAEAMDAYVPPASATGGVK